MSKIRITMYVDPSYADPGHPTGLTNDGYEAISEALGEFGSNVEFEAVP